ncbi:MAG: HD domain-containing protein [Acidimicrobiia bacterium]|nr:HD domain-containing protein [Acidimicrobiia bacterium]
MSDLVGQRATFTRMDQSTKEDWDIIMANLSHHAETTVADRVLDQLALLEGDHGGFACDRLTHSLQTAHLAERDGKDDEYLVCALLHDIGDVLAPFNHPEIGAAIVKPYVSEANHWMVLHHGTIQGYYFWHHIGLDRNARDALVDSPHYEPTVEFCGKYDQMAFDPDGVTPPLSHYEPLVRSVLRAG